MLYRCYRYKIEIPKRRWEAARLRGEQSSWGGVLLSGWMSSAGGWLEGRKSSAGGVENKKRNSPRITISSWLRFSERCSCRCGIIRSRLRDKTVRLKEQGLGGVCFDVVVGPANERRGSQRPAGEWEGQRQRQAAFHPAPKTPSGCPACRFDCS